MYACVDTQFDTQPLPKIEPLAPTRRDHVERRGRVSSSPVLPSRLRSLVLLVALLAAGCADSLPSANASSPTTSASEAVPALPSTLTLLHQARGASDYTHRLTVKHDGYWVCDGCGANGATRIGRLTIDQVGELEKAMLDPGLTSEDDQRRPKAACDGDMFTTMMTSLALVSWTGCPGDVPPPITALIVRLLTETTSIPSGMESAKP